MAHSEFSANDAGLSAIIADEAVSLAMLNAVARQQKDSVIAQAVTAMGASTILSISPAETASPQASAGLASVGVSAAPDAFASEVGLAGPEPATADMIASAEVAQDILEGPLRMMAFTVALTVQDAANYLRNVQTLSTAAIACALMQPDAIQPVLSSPTAAEVAVEVCTSAFQQLCSTAMEILRELRELRASDRSSEEGRGASAELLQATAQALSIAAQNAVSNQQQENISSQAATVMGVATLYSIDTAAVGESVEKILHRSNATAPETEGATAVA